MLALRCGDLRTGYFDLDLKYSEVAISADDVRQLRQLGPNVDGEVLYDEIDVADVGYVHRLLFSPSAEIEIFSRELAISMIPLDDREIVREGLIEESR